MLAIKVVHRNQQGNLFIPCRDVEQCNELMNDLYWAIKNKDMLCLEYRPDYEVTLNGAEILYVRKTQIKQEEK